MIVRQAIGYVVQIDGPYLQINLLEESRSYVVGHRDGISTVEQPGDLIGVAAGEITIIVRISSIAFAEPKEVYSGGRNNMVGEPLRQLKGYVIGHLYRNNDSLEFQPRDSRLPVLGASAFPLSEKEVSATISATGADGKLLSLGNDIRNPSTEIRVGVDDLLGRHVAVLGATGQGKTHFVAAMLQRLAKFPNSRIIVFDVNGEYDKAFPIAGTRVKHTTLGTGNERDFKIPYFALGRHGLTRLFIPSEKAQMPALRFAIEHLKYVQSDGSGARANGSTEYALNDDCVSGTESKAQEQLTSIRDRNVNPGDKWPHMRAISCLACEWYVQKAGTNTGKIRDSFLYGHVQPLINRIRGFIEDPQFTNIVDIAGSNQIEPKLCMRSESSKYVNKIFGKGKYESEDWSVHIIDLSQLTQDLMPFVLGSLLEMFAAELFSRGPRGTHPTALALEEAHHYLRKLPVDDSSGEHFLAYERLAKEGRKFGLSLIISTQRPSEVTPTVLAQCGTWAVFRLSNESDQRAVAAASVNSGDRISRQLSGLGRGEAIVFGSALDVPSRIHVIRPDPVPDSKDPEFLEMWNDSDSGQGSN